VIALDPLARSSEETLRNLERAALRQTCHDFELIIRTATDLRPTELGGRLKRVPSALASSRAQALADGLGMARGRYALATYGSPAALLDDPAQIEKMLRLLRSNPALDALALAHAGDLPPFRLLGSGEVDAAQLGAVCWAATGPSAPPSSLELPGDSPLESLARWLTMTGTLQWRHLSRLDRHRLAPSPDTPRRTIGAPRRGRDRDAQIRAAAEADLPDIPQGVAERIRQPRVWTPPQARVLCRHLHHASGRYLFTNRAEPPPGCSLHYHLGSVRALPLAGTTSLLHRADRASEAFVFGEETDIDAPELLGFVEQAPLPLFDALQVARHRVTRQQVLIAGLDDPLAKLVEELDPIGYIEPYPIHPRNPPHVEVPYGVVGLVRVLDLRARRHRYAAGRIPNGQLAGELGSLLIEPVGECEPVWIDDEGRLLAESGPYVNGRPQLGTAVRWAGAPLTWRGFGTAGPRMRATARRAYDSARIITSTRRAAQHRECDVAGYLLRSASARTVPLYAATHPVTGDQLLSTDPAEPGALGYGHATLLGHLAAQAPVTGNLGLVRPGVPWATRFGLASLSQ
jgi:hypothetical protein